MGVLTNEFLLTLEDNMRVVTENTYMSLLEKQWWRRIARELSSQSRKEKFNWLIETGFMGYMTEGDVQFHDLAIQSQEFEAQFIGGSGLKMLRSQLEDLDGNGVEVATAWSRTMGALAAYFPQQEVAKAILANPLTYDGLAMFHQNTGGTTGHPLNPKDTAKGRFANLFTSTADLPNNPGACPIQEGITLDVAQANLNKALSYIRSIKQPNGVNPRNIQAKFLFVPTALNARARLVTGAKMVAQDAASGGGSADVSMYIDTFGLEVIEVPELGAAYPGGSDTTYYIGCELLGLAQGAFTYVNREPVTISYHGPQTDAQLASRRDYEWFVQGRSVVGPGHPFLLFKVLAT